MKSLLFIILYAAAALTVASCRREAAAPPQQEGATGTVTTTVTAQPQNLQNAQVNTVVATDTNLYATQSRLGSAVGADGLVTQEKSEFAPGEPVRLSMWLRDSPAGLQTSARLEDSNGKEIDVERKPMNGEKTVTFTVGDGKLKPGQYKVIGYWGGNVAAEHEFTVSKRAAARDQ